MSTTAKIDFEPGLFDEDRPEAASDLPTLRPKRRPNRAALVVAGGLLLVLAVAFLALNTTAEIKPFPAIIAEGQQRPVRAILTPAPGVGGTPILQKAAVGDAEGFCVGYEAMCATSTTDKPAETLAKLAAALPHGQAKRYRVKVSVEPVGQ
jgi:hypothetical protein